MSERPDIYSDSADAPPAGVAVSAPDIKQWFIREVLPLEAALMQYLQHNWRNKSDIADIQQEVYLRVFRAARENGLPERPKQFVFAAARNLLINRARDESVVPIEAVADLEALEAAAEAPGPDRVVQARDELRHLQVALDRLPPQCRQVVVLARIEGLSRREIAERMGIAEPTVANHLAHGIRLLVDMLLGETTVRRNTP